jgi:hypothetical protein
MRAFEKPVQTQVAKQKSHRSAQQTDEVVDELADKNAKLLKEIEKL